MGFCGIKMENSRDFYEIQYQIQREFNRDELHSMELNVELFVYIPSGIDIN